VTCREFVAHPYKTTILFIDSPGSWRRRVGALGYHDDWPTSIGQVQRFGNVRYSPTLIVSFDLRQVRALSWGEVAGLCAHEATHVVRTITREIGEDFLGDEAEAHFVESLTAWLWQNLVDGFVNKRL
jgi:hypothetical protein